MWGQRPEVNLNTAGFSMGANPWPAGINFSYSTTTDIWFTKPSGQLRANLITQDTLCRRTLPSMLCGKLLLWRQHEPLAADNSEVEYAQHIPDQGPIETRAVGFVEEHRHQTDYCDCGANQRTSAAQRAGVWALNVGKITFQNVIRESLHGVGDDRAKHGKI